MWSARRRLVAPLITLGLVAGTMACRGRLARLNPFADSDVASAEQTKPAKPVGAPSNTLKALGRALPPGDPGPCDLVFEVHTEGNVYAISPLIYGNNYDVRDLSNQRWGVLRSGGNRLTAYNWETNASNAGSDYLFQNDGLMSASDEPAKPVLDFIDAASSIGAHTLVTVSNADYVAADKNGNGDVRASGPTYLTTRFKKNLPTKPTPFAATPDVSDGFVYQDEFVAYLKAKRPQAKLLFAMDNEPELWAHTHAEIFPAPVTYAGLWKRNHDFAKATKKVWPEAKILGFVSYGYTGFVSLQNAPDGQGRNFIEWYLDQAKAAEKSGGKRLIDYLDLHWYPEAQGGGQRIVSDANTSDVVSARVQAPRSLWDAKYKETSWVVDAAGGPIRLLPWVRAKIDAHYPGTKLSISEWNYGGGKHASGAVAVADVLGIFARERVDLATYWAMSHEEPFTYAAFRIFRNYDGHGAAFGDTFVPATTSDVKKASVYASIDSKDATRTVIVAINKDSTPRRAGIAITHPTIYRSAKTWVLAGQTPAVKNGPELSPVATNSFRYDMPAYSVSVIVPQQ